MKSRIVSMSIALCMLSLSSTNAQTLGPMGLELGAGVVKGSTSGEYRTGGGGISADVAVGLRLLRLFGGGLAAAVGLGAHGTGATTDICLPRTTGTGCVPRFPEFTSFWGLIGWETNRANLRILAGPTVMHADSSSGIAWMARIDLATPPISRIALTASIRGISMPDYRGDSFRFRGLGLGIRIR